MGHALPDIVIHLHSYYFTRLLNLDETLDSINSDLYLLPQLFYAPRTTQTPFNQSTGIMSDGQVLKPEKDFTQEADKQIPEAQELAKVFLPRYRAGN